MQTISPRSVLVTALALACSPGFAAELHFSGFVTPTQHCQTATDASFSVTVRNQGSTSASNVRVTLAFPPFMNGVCAGGGWDGSLNCIPSANGVICNPYDSTTYTVTCNLTAALAAGGTKKIYVRAYRGANTKNYYVAAGAVADGSEVDPSNNSVSYRFTARRQGDFDNLGAPGYGMVETPDNQILAQYIADGNLPPALTTYANFTCYYSGEADIDIYDLVLHQNYIVGNVPCLQRCDYYPDALRSSEPDENQVTATVDAPEPSSNTVPWALVPAEGSAVVSASTGLAAATGSGTLPLAIDLRNVKAEGRPMELGGFIVRVTFDPKELEFLGGDPAAGMQTLAVTDPAKANSTGSIRIVGVSRPGSALRGVVSLAGARFRVKTRRGGGSTTTTLEQASSHPVIDEKGARMFSISVK